MNAKADLERLVDDVADLAHLNADQIFVKHAEVYDFQLFGESASAISSVKQSESYSAWQHF